MRDYSRIEHYLNYLSQDIYPQPPDPGHTAWAEDAIVNFLCDDEKQAGELKIKTVLDVGCGEGFCSDIFKEMGMEWTGVTLGANDYPKAANKGDAFPDDATFLHFESERFDLIFARHILEHSPMPLLTLMEWHRVARNYLLLVFPAWEYWLTYGKNHYYMFTKDQLWWLLARSGWKIMDQEDFTTEDELFMDYFLPDNKPEERVWSGPHKPVEYRYLCVKGEPKIE